MPTLSCLIPLYQSQRFLPWIIENIDSHLEIGAEIIISDRHMLDDTITILKNKYASHSSVRLLTSSDCANWVLNINALISASSGEFFRIIPHDDTATAESSARLVEVLKQEQDAILATGVVKAYDLNGTHLPTRDELNPKESSGCMSWAYEDALSLFWLGRFGGAFKGVIRAQPIKKAELLILETQTLVSSERAWLFGLALLGRFAFVPRAEFVKRYYEKSTHRSWSYTGQTVLDCADVMCQYSTRLIADPVARRNVIFNIFENARRRAQWIEAATGPTPSYLPLLSTENKLSSVK